MLSRHSSFVPRRRYLVFGFLMLLSWCLLTLPHLWFAYHGARAVSDGPRQRQIKQDYVVTSHGTTNSSSPAISEAQNLPTHAGPALTAESAKHAKETRGNSDVLIVDHEDSRTDDVPIKVNNNNEFDNERINRSDDVRIQNSGNDNLAMENNSFASDENISSEGRENDVVANIGHDVPTNSKHINGTERFPWKPFKAEGVNCSKLFAGDESELRLAQDIQPPAYNTTDLIRDASSCSDFVAQNGFITSPLTSMERDFPIAYSVLVYKEPVQVVDLLRAIYRPQNYYCLHVDNNTRRLDQDAFRAIAKCFTNVFLSSRSARVIWGEFGVLQAEIFCMKDLYQYPDWRYFINLTGQEFPLKTNYEIVKILQALRGANDVLVQNTWKFMERWCRYLPAPHNLTIYKGSVHIAVSRPFVHYVLTSSVANDFLHWIRPIKIPDEVFFNTLNHNPHLGVPGSYNGPYVWRNFTHKPHLSRFKNWDHTKQWRCAGRKYVRKICILSAGDLPLLDARPELFANKFHFAYSHVARQCLTEKLYNRTRQETLGTLTFDVTFYEHLPFLRHIVRGPEP